MTRAFLYEVTFAGPRTFSITAPDTSGEGLVQAARVAADAALQADDWFKPATAAVTGVKYVGEVWVDARV